MKSNKERFEKRPERMDKRTPDDLIILAEAGSLSSSKESYESALTHGKAQSQAPEDLLEISQTGVASSTRDAFEKGKVRNASKKIADEDDVRPEAGFTSQTKAAFEKDQVIHAEVRQQREMDITEELPNTGGTAEVKKRFARALSSEDKQEKRLSYLPEKGSAASARAIYEQSAAESSRKKVSSQEEEDELPQAGVARCARERFEKGEVIRAEGSQQESWREDLPPTGAAQATKAALAVAAAPKEHHKTQEEDGIPSPGCIASTKSRLEEEFETDTRRNVYKEEAEVSPGLTRQNASLFQNPESLLKPTERTIDKEKEELSTVQAGMTSQAKERLHQEAHKVTEKTLVEDDIPGAGYIASTKSRLEEEVDGKKVLQKEEATVSPGLTKEHASRFENVESLMKQTERTIDKEREDLSAVTPGQTRETKDLLNQEAKKSTPKMIDSEDFTGIKDTRKMSADIEAGKLAKPVVKTIANEDLPCGGMTHASRAAFITASGH